MRKGPLFCSFSPNSVIDGLVDIDVQSGRSRRQNRFYRDSNNRFPPIALRQRGAVTPRAEEIRAKQVRPILFYARFTAEGEGDNTTLDKDSIHRRHARRRPRCHRRPHRPRQQPPSPRRHRLRQAARQARRPRARHLDRTRSQARRGPRAPAQAPRTGGVAALRLTNTSSQPHHPPFVDLPACPVHAEPQQPRGTRRRGRRWRPGCGWARVRARRPGRGRWRGSWRPGEAARGGVTPKNSRIDRPLRVRDPTARAGAAVRRSWQPGRGAAAGTVHTMRWRRSAVGAPFRDRATARVRSIGNAASSPMASGAGARVGLAGTRITTAARRGVAWRAARFGPCAGPHDISGRESSGRATALLTCERHAP